MDVNHMKMNGQTKDSLVYQEKEKNGRGVGKITIEFLPFENGVPWWAHIS